MIIDTYDLGNGYRAELNEDSRSDFYVNIKKGDLTSHSFLFFDNPFDAIFILMDLGLIRKDPYEGLHSNIPFYKR